MAEPTTQRNPDAQNAQYTLERLARCSGIKPVRPGDEELRCATDQVPLVGNPLRHDPEYIRWLRETADPT